MTSPPTRTPVVFDCNVFAQALINPRGPAGRCLLLAQQGRVRLFLSDFILNELRELPAKLPVKLGVTLDRVEALIVDLAKYAEPVAKVPSLFTYARDPDHALYVSRPGERRNAGRLARPRSARPDERRQRGRPNAARKVPAVSCAHSARVLDDGHGRVGGNDGQAGCFTSPASTAPARSPRSRRSSCRDGRSASARAPA